MLRAFESEVTKQFDK